MILELVKSAVETKITCKAESPLISEAEYCYAAALALKRLEQTELLRQVKDKHAIADLRQLVEPVFQAAYEVRQKEPQMERLLHMLIGSRVEGEIKEEVRELLLGT